MTWHGANDLETFLRPLEELRPHPENPRRGDVEIVKTSLERFGQQKPVITDRDDHDLIVAGNHTFFAARSLGWTHIAAIEMWAEAEEGERYMLIDNRTSDSSTYDREVLLRMLDEQPDEDILATGFTVEERERLRQEVEEERRARSEFEAGRDSDEPEQSRPAPVTVRNLLLKDLDDPAFEKLSTHLKVLQREWGIVGNSEVVAEAARREVLRLREADADA
jgi:ParB-like chromosome segregation protein Spo0J